MTRLSPFSTLRVLVERDPQSGELKNLIPNPKAESGVDMWGWSMSGGHASSYTGFNWSGGVLAFVSHIYASTSTTQLTTDPMKITGTHVRYAFAGTFPSHFIDFYNGDALLSSVSLGSLTSEALLSTVRAVPVGTTHARVRLQAPAVTVAEGAAWFAIRKIALAEGAAADLALMDSADIPGIYWADVTGSTADIRIGRAELQVGTLESVIVSPELDPSVSTALRPGRKIQVQANIAAASAPEPSWSSVYTGRIRSARVDYRLLDPDPQRRSVITLSAVDVISEIAQIAAPDSPGSFWELSYLFSGNSIPFVFGLGGTYLTPRSNFTSVATNDNASIVDQIAILRDTEGGIVAFGDRDGYVRFNPPISFRSGWNETRYNADISVDYSTERLVNVVNVEALERNPATGGTSTASYGPYRDEASIKEWGAWEKTYTMQGLSPAEIETRAKSILNANKTPRRHINHITVPITAGRLYEATYEIGNTLSVTNQRAGFVGVSQSIVGIEHDIQASREHGVKWLMRLNFAPDGSSAPPQIVPKPSQGAGFVPGRNAFQVGDVLVQTGLIVKEGSSTYWTDTVTFPVPFSEKPRVIINGSGVAAEQPGIIWTTSQTNTNASSFQWGAQWNDAATHTRAGSATWIAIGRA